MKISLGSRRRKDVSATTPLLRLQAVVGPSVRLRDALLADLLAEWTGPVQRLIEPPDLATLLLDLDTPSLFGDSALLVVRADQNYVVKHADLLVAQVAKPITAGSLILLVPKLDQRSALVKALAKVKALHLADVPDPKIVVEWLAERIAAHPQGADDPRAIAVSLVDHVGAEPDGLLGAIEILAIYAGDGPLHRAGAEALHSGLAERPVFDLTGAFFEGKAKRAIELLHAGGGAEPELVLAAILGDLRRQIACSETANDDEAAKWVGAKGSLYYARKRAKELGRPTLLRLFIGALQCQRHLRTTGIDPTVALEMFVLNAQRVIAPGRR